MPRAIVASHSTAQTCWMALYGYVYDVTGFLPSHPGGAQAILSLAGRDATAEYDRIHPPGTLEAHLAPEARLGRFMVPAAGPPPQPSSSSLPAADGPPLEEMLNIRDLESAATRRLTRKAHAYYSSAADDLRSKELNRLAWGQILLRPRVFVDVSACSTATSLLGALLPVKTPLFACPTAAGRLAHPDGERAVARASARSGAMYILSQFASMTPEQVAEGAAPDGQAMGWQLYVQQDRRQSEAMLARIGKMRDRYRFVCLTLDSVIAGNREDDERAGLEERRQSRRGEGGVAAQFAPGMALDLTWQITLEWLVKHTDLPIVLKGIQTHEDALLASRVSPQVRAVVLSNHGGRSLDTAPPAAHTLLEIRRFCPDVFSRIEVWVDGGVSRGTDVVKALCLGAKAVGVGRPPLWGLAVAGQAGVERMFDILQREIVTSMRMLGARSIEELGPRFVNTRVLERDVYAGEPTARSKL